MGGSRECGKERLRKELLMTIRRQHYEDRGTGMKFRIVGMVLFSVFVLGALPTGADAQGIGRRSQVLQQAVPIAPEPVSPVEQLQDNLIRAGVVDPSTVPRLRPIGVTGPGRPGTFRTGDTTLPIGVTGPGRPGTFRPGDTTLPIGVSGPGRPGRMPGQNQTAPPGKCGGG